jgi:zinc and cadmium transporter
MSPYITLSIYCLGVAAASILGGFFPLWIRLTHTRTQLLMSFVAGLMLGVSFFHLLPHAVAELHSIDPAVAWMVGGFAAMFMLSRAFHFHQHEPPTLDHSAHDPSAHAPAAHDHSAHGAHAPCRHGHEHGAGQASMNWLGVAIGMSIHSLIDGVALAANVVAEAEEVGPRLFVGLGTFLAIALHKPLDSLSITAIMTTGGWSVAARRRANFAFSLICPLGCLIFVLGIHRAVEHQSFALGCVLGLAAGVFLCIAVADLMPELELHSHDRFRLTVALLLGIALAYGIHAIEPAHSHSHEQHGRAPSGHEAIEHVAGYATRYREDAGLATTARRPASQVHDANLFHDRPPLFFAHEIAELQELQHTLLHLERTHLAVVPTGN